MATFYPTIRIRGDSPRFLILWECLIWGNRKSRQLMRHSKLWKNIKSSETFYWSASWRSSGLAEIQTGTWGGWALMMIMWRSASLQIATALNTLFASPLFRCFEVADIGQQRLGHYWADRCMLAAPHGLPKQICGLGTKKRDAATKTCL